LFAIRYIPRTLGGKVKALWPVACGSWSGYRTPPDPRARKLTIVALDPDSLSLAVSHAVPGRAVPVPTRALTATESVNIEVARGAPTSNAGRALAQRRLSVDVPLCHCERGFAICETRCRPREQLPD
jgi:hypothetical protein